MRAREDLLRWAETAGAILGWAAARVRDSLPAPLRHAGWSDDADLARITETGALAVTGVRQVSWFGARRVRAGAPGRAGRRLVVSLPEHQQFRSQIALSASACRRGDRAIALRKAEFSPIPVQDAVFDHAFGAATDDGGADVDVAIARKSAVEDAAALAAARSRDWEIVGGVDTDGAPRFRFSRNEQALHASGWGRAMLVYLLLVAALLAWSNRSEQDLAQEVRLQAATASATRDVRAARERLDRLEARAEFSRAEPRLGDVLSGLAQAAVDADPDDAIERVRLDGAGGLQLQVSRTSEDGVETAHRQQSLEEPA